MAQPTEPTIQTEETKKEKKSMHKHTAKKTTAKKTTAKAKKTTAKKTTAPQSKAQVILAMLAKGATREAIQDAVQWESKSVRGFVSTLRTIKGIEVIDSWTKDGARAWKLGKGEYAKLMKVTPK